MPTRADKASKWREAPAAGTSGFTLLELLVTIAIIGILAALLLPALSRAKDQAVRAIDTGNLKQMTVALHLYAGDNQDVIPWCNWASGDQSDHPGWLYTRNTDSLNALQADIFAVDTGVFWPILKNERLYFCPKDNTNSTLFFERKQRISSYVMNGAVCGYNRAIFPCSKLADLPSDGVVFWETDEKNPNYFNDGASFPTEGVSQRHEEGAIDASFDGAVGFIKFSAWSNEAANTNKNRLWCFIGSSDGR